jgi:hypothetical protein
MTRDEVRLVAFVILALCLGAGVQWWRGGGSSAAAGVAPATVEKKKGWAKPPYVFKSRAQMEALKESLEGDRPQR